MHRLIALALVVLTGLSGAAHAQSYGLPEIGIATSGASRSLAVRDRSNSAMVPFATLNTSTHRFDLGTLADVTSPNGITLSIGAWLDALTPHVASNTALAAAPAGWKRVIRDGFAAAGDGGQASYTYSASACPIAGGDGGTQIPSGSGGCWRIDWGSVGQVAMPTLFVGNFGGNSPATDTAAVQAAINTGKAVVIPNNFTASTGMVCHTIGQKISGLGHRVTFITIPSTFDMSAKGVFYSDVSIEPGCEWTDFSVFFSQPAAPPFIQYPPMIYNQPVNGVPQARMRGKNLGCYVAWVCFDLRGATGGNNYNDIEASALWRGVVIDGAQDNIRLDQFHGQLYFTTTQQQSYIDNNLIWIDSGRSDGLDISNSLFITGTLFNFHVGDNGQCTSASMTNVSFDTYRVGMYVSCGTISISDGYAGTNGTPNPTQLLNMTGGRVTINGLRFISFGGNFVSNATSHIVVNGTGLNTATDAYGATKNCVGFGYCGFPELTITATPVFMNNDSPFLTLYQGTVQLLANNFTQNYTVYQNQFYDYTGKALAYSKIYTARNAGKAARMTAIGNRINDMGNGGTGSFLAATASSDDWSIWHDNIAPGWAITPPTTQNGTGQFLGSYSPNLSGAR